MHGGEIVIKKIAGIIKHKYYAQIDQSVDGNLPQVLDGVMKFNVGAGTRGTVEQRIHAMEIQQNTI